MGCLYFFSKYRHVRLLADPVKNDPGPTFLYLLPAWRKSAGPIHRNDVRQFPRFYPGQDDPASAMHSICHVCTHLHERRRSKIGRN